MSAVQENGGYHGDPGLAFTRAYSVFTYHKLLMLTIVLASLVKTILYGCQD